MQQPSDDAVYLDVREDLKAGKEPLGRIQATAKTLTAGQKFVIRTTFEPIPLYHMMQGKGYRHESKHLGPEDWEVTFVPDAAAKGAAKEARTGPAASSSAAAEVEDDWPAPESQLDNRGLMPPEPMMRILATLESMEPGQVLAAINEREPLFLYPELEARGHSIRVAKKSDGVYLTIRHGGEAGA